MNNNFEASVQTMVRHALIVAPKYETVPLTVVASVQISFRLLTVLAIAAMVSAVPLTTDQVHPSRPPLSSTPLAPKVCGCGGGLFEPTGAHSRNSQVSCLSRCRFCRLDPTALHSYMKAKPPVDRGTDEQLECARV